MTESVQETKNSVTLKGSAKLVTDYLNFGINSILYQRGIYPPETFKTEDHFGLAIYVTTNPDIIQFINTVLGQIKDWLLAEKVKKITLAITNISNKETIERWDFKLEYLVSKETNERKEGSPISKKELRVIQNEIRDVLRQISSTVSFLPYLDAPCSFDLKVYTNSDADVPENWGESEPIIITNSQQLQLRSFSTCLHKMDTIVSYKQTE